MLPILFKFNRTPLMLRSALTMPNYSALVKFYSKEGGKYFSVKILSRIKIYKFVELEYVNILGVSDRFVEVLKMAMKQAELMELSDQSMDAAKYIINFILKSIFI